VSAPAPISPDRLATLIADRCTDRLVHVPRLRVAVDGASTAEPGNVADPANLADAVAELLLARGIPAVRVRAAYFSTAASLRFEFGRTDPDAFLDLWLDADGLRREVLVPWGPEGTGRYLPSRWDPVRDRATRAAYQTAPATGVLLCDGVFLLGRDLPFDLTVHVWLSAGALRRRLPPEEWWTLTAFARYDEEADPAASDIVVRADDPRHPAVLVREPG
jgi:hypothetical protein